MGTLLGIALVILAAYSVRKLFTAASEPVKLPPDEFSAQSGGSSPPETVVAEVLVKTGDLKHHPIRITYPHNDEGRLVLTNVRLLYLSYDQKSTTLTVPLREISHVEVGEKKGFLTSTKTVTVICRKDGGRDRRTTWSVPAEIIDYGGAFMSTKRQANRHTNVEFADLLNRERAKPLSMPEVTIAKPYVSPPEPPGLSLKSKAIIGAILAVAVLVFVWISARRH